MEEDGEVPTASLSVWIILILISLISFWCQATVTEERFVPALNIISERFRIPDDIAGATLMAAGASSPELFSSIVSLFITHSALGLGTIVGSEIFNQLIICAGAVYASKTGNLKLDPAVVIREVSFYGLSILLLYIALRDRRPDEDDSSGVDHIYISFTDAMTVFIGYIAYVIVCANMDRIIACCTCTKLAKEQLMTQEEKDTSYGTATLGKYSKRVSIKVPDMPFMKSSIMHEPAANFSYKKEELFQTRTGGKYSERTLDGAIGEVDTGVSTSSRQSWANSFSKVSERFRRFSDGASLREFAFFVNNEKPSDEHGLYDLELNSYEERLSCFLWQRSFFYTKARVAKNGWHLRWFSFTPDGIYSVPNRTNYGAHRMTYPLFDEFEIDDQRFVFRVPCPKRDYYWMAPSKEILLAVTKKVEEIIDARERKAPLMTTPEEKESCDGQSNVSGQQIQYQNQRQMDETDNLVAFGEENVEDSDYHMSLLEFPGDGTFFSFFFYFILYPLRFVMHYTIPDVRVLDKEGNPTTTLNFAFLAVLSCLIWLVVGSYAMVASLENLAKLMDIPEAVVGVTVSAVGTSLPNYVASRVAAENGFGNMAVSNAFGSNTFNIMIGLGFPWVLYTIFGTHFEPYHQLRDDGITESVIILSIVLIIFVALVFPCGFVIYKWHGNVFIFLYFAYLVYAIGQVYW